MVQNASTDSDIKQALAAYGYTDEKLATGVTLYNESNTLFSNQSKEYLEMYDAINKFIDARILCEDHFSDVSKLGPVALRNNPLAKHIMPTYPMPDGFNAWKKEATDFYMNILNDAMALQAYTVLGYTESRINDLIQEIVATEALLNNRAIESSEAQEATKLRDLKFAELKSFCFDLRIVARIALADTPQLLEKLGIIARN